MSPAMYFGIGYAVNHVAADDDLAGLIITGTGDVFAPGGDLGGAGGDDWMNFGSLPMEALLPFDTLRTSRKPVVSAVNGLAQGAAGCRCSTAASPTRTTATCWRG
jgi:enoyl-CoA hydratase